MADLKVDVRREGEIGFLKLDGEARLEQSDTVRKAVRSLLAEGAKHVLLGVKGLGFADSASVGMLMEIQKEITARGGKLVLHGCSLRFSKMLEAMGLASRFPCAANEAAAQKAVA